MQMEVIEMNEKTRKILLGSKEQGWLTPPDELRKWEKRFGFYSHLDPCTTPDNPLNTPKFYTEEDDGLEQSWDVSDELSIFQDTLTGGLIEIKQAVYANPGYGTTYRVMKRPDNGLTELQRKIMTCIDKGIYRTSLMVDEIQPNLVKSSHTHFRKKVSGQLSMLVEIGVLRKQTLGDWIRKAYWEHRRHGSMIVMLLPLRAPRWYHDFILPYLRTVEDPLNHYVILRGRLTFVGAEGPCPFDNVLWIQKQVEDDE